jgi:hypothetical protein
MQNKNREKQLQVILKVTLIDDSASNTIPDHNTMSAAIGLGSGDSMMSE